MKRWLILLFLFAGAPGCAMIEDWVHDDSPWVHGAPISGAPISAAAPQPSCGVVPAGGFVKTQTQEPELLLAR